MQAIASRGWGFVQRLARLFDVRVEEYMGRLNEMPLRRRERARDLGRGHVGEGNPVAARLVIKYGPDYTEPWFLATNLDAVPAQIVRLYQRRMWIETMFRDWRNKRWGFGMREIALSEPEWHDNLFTILAIAYIYLSICWTYIEHIGPAKTLKANTQRERAMTLLGIGIRLVRRRPPVPTNALKALRTLPS